MYRGIIAALLMLGATAALAADVCPLARQQQFAQDPATRIVAIACIENMLWFRPFIDSDGRIASSSVMEGEASLLGDGATQAWRRVAGYWRESGLLPQMSAFPGGSECAYASSDRYPSSACRAFIIDNPWSAAFVSWVMKKADVPGFRASASHIDYVRDAYLHPDTSAFLYLDPASAKPAAGDLLCYVRVPGRAYGYEGLVAAVAAGNGGLNMHCDVVVAANPDGDGKVYLIGGNVQQGVTMRLLRVNRNGNFWALPQRVDGDAQCSPDNASSCNFSRQDWAVLLKLKPASALAQLPRPAYDMPTSLQATPENPAGQACCVNCIVGSSVQRCPASRSP